MCWRLRLPEGCRWDYWCARRRLCSLGVLGVGHAGRHKEESPLEVLMGCVLEVSMGGTASSVLTPPEASMGDAASASTVLEVF